MRIGGSNYLAGVSTNVRSMYSSAIRRVTQAGSDALALLQSRNSRSKDSGIENESNNLDSQAINNFTSRRSAFEESREQPSPDFFQSEYHMLLNMPTEDPRSSAESTSVLAGTETQSPLNDNSNPYSQAGSAYPNVGSTPLHLKVESNNPNPYGQPGQKYPSIGSATPLTGAENSSSIANL